MKNAILKGYTPKIFIIDYKMYHVEDSNYRMALSQTLNVDNLKIVEENAKGRTSLFKLIGPNMRNMFRVAAFQLRNAPGNNYIDENAINESCGANLADLRLMDDDIVVTPGISMADALRRLSCSGYNVKFGHYVFDFTGMPLEPVVPKVYFYGLKEVNGIKIA